MIGLGNLHGLKAKKVWQTGVNCKKGIINVEFKFLHALQSCETVRVGL